MFNNIVRLNMTALWALVYILTWVASAVAAIATATPAIMIAPVAASFIYGFTLYWKRSS